MQDREAAALSAKLPVSQCTLPVVMAVCSLLAHGCNCFTRAELSCAACADEQHSCKHWLITGPCTTTCGLTAAPHTKVKRCTDPIGKQYHAHASSKQRVCCHPARNSSQGLLR
jgi:hypothetical protein